MNKHIIVNLWCTLLLEGCWLVTATSRLGSFPNEAMWDGNRQDAPDIQNRRSLAR
jgi:hypothetical protein